jgi:hypothetical protein
VAVCRTPALRGLVGRAYAVMTATPRMFPHANGERVSSILRAGLACLKRGGSLIRGFSAKYNGQGRIGRKWSQEADCRSGGCEFESRRPRSQKKAQIIGFAAVFVFGSKYGRFDLGTVRGHRAGGVVVTLSPPQGANLDKRKRSGATAATHRDSRAPKEGIRCVRWMLSKSS